MYTTVNNSLNSNKYNKGNVSITIKKGKKRKKPHSQEQTQRLDNGDNNCINGNTITCSLNNGIGNKKR